MTEYNGKYFFGYWKGMPYGEPTDKFEDFKEFKKYHSERQNYRAYKVA
ncbi:MAG: hypothetical protein LUG85_07270 [Clostridiales bacterium]|nr:hypothetical protein [Clostridiales bacterium]